MARNRGSEPLRVPEGFWARDAVQACLGDRDIGRLFTLIQRYAGASQTQLGVACGLEQGYVSRIIAGRKVRAIDLLERIADGCAMPDESRLTLGLATRSGRGRTAHTRAAAGFSAQAEQETPDGDLLALELARRITATDVGAETLAGLEQAVDDLATRYPRTPPTHLLPDVRRYLTFVAHLLDARTTLAEHRRLLVAAGWLSLLSATVEIDLGQTSAAATHLRTAQSLAAHTGHREIHAWCLETRAWSVLTDGDYARSLSLSRAAQHIAPRGSSVHIQAIAQEGRSWARLGRRQETYSALDRVAALVSPMPQPDRPEHHFVYDPDKSVAYAATTLAWLGDRAAEPHARQVIERLRPGAVAGQWPRHRTRT